MPFDGLVINSLVSELDSALKYERIEKVYQPEDDEIILKLRDKKLLLSVNSNFPHFCLTKFQKSNPLNPPMFCMLLRKHIQGGKIISINQIEFERIVEISIDSYDELGNQVLKKIYIEIMGKHSNLILVDSQSQKIIDSIKRIPSSVSRIRQLLPGLKYEFPPSQNKVNLLLVDFKDFYEILLKSPNKSIYKVLYKSFQGISPLYAKEICERSNLDPDMICKNIDDTGWNSFWDSIAGFKKLINNKSFSPNIIIDSLEKKIIDFSSILLKVFENNNYIISSKESMSIAVEEYYYEKNKYERIREKSLNIKKFINTRLERLYKKIQKQKEELLIAHDADRYRIYGELLLSNLHKISKGMNEIEVENFYEGMTKIKIPLNIRLNPSENSQDYFKKYNKYKSALKKVQAQIQETELEISYLENVLTSINNAEDLNDIEEIKQELIEQNYIKKKIKGNQKKRVSESQFSKYISSDGFNIQSGKNNKQNDYLTLKIASKNDIWLHTKDIPGSHVIVFSKGEKVPHTTIIEAAIIAAYNSKGRYSGNVPVDYTMVKNVKKPSGAKPGMVYYDNFKTVYVTPKENEIEKLKNKS